MGPQALLAVAGHARHRRHDAQLRSQTWRGVRFSTPQKTREKTPQKSKIYFPSGFSFKRSEKYRAAPKALRLVGWPIVSATTMRTVALTT